MDVGTPVRVLAHAGGRGEEEPRAFELDGRRLAVQWIAERWAEPGGRGFRVLADDGRRYELYCRDEDSAWSLRARPDEGMPAAAEKLAFLARSESYADRPREVEVVETHMAWVFLAGAHAYKMKKPVRHAYLDFSTLLARERVCLEELRLNRRLAPDVYLGLVPLTLEPGDRLRLGGEGIAVEWLVRMRRLPRERMLDRRIAAGEVDPADLRRLARLLGRFHRRLAPERIAPEAHVESLRRAIAGDRDDFLAAADSLEPERLERIAGELEAFVDRRADLLEARVRAGRIVEGHGDLRPEHVCLERVPVVIDCLEFERAFRVLDAADELAYLAMECEHLGAPEVGRAVLAGACRVTGDAPPAELLDFHMARRAFLRGKLSIWHLRDGGVREPERWVRKARAYLDLAEAHLPLAARR